MSTTANPSAETTTADSMAGLPALMTYEETAKAVGISRRQIQRMVGSGSFPAPKKFGKGQSALTRFRKADVVKWINGGCRKVKK